MVFASLIFLFLFLPLNLLLYYSTKNATWRNWLLIVFSLFFYGWGEPIWISLMILSCMVDWGNALFIQKHRGTKWAKGGVVITLIFNLGLVATFKYDVAITNFSHEFWPPFRARESALFDRFRDIVVSGDEKLVKPYPAIYQLALARFGLEPAQAVFIDDNRANIDAAAALGIHALHFTDEATLRPQLRELGLVAG